MRKTTSILKLFSLKYLLMCKILEIQTIFQLNFKFDIFLEILFKLYEKK